MPRCYVFTPPSSSTSALINSIYPNADGAVISIPWSGDTTTNANNGGWETSNIGNTASAGYNYTNFDNVINTQLSYGCKRVVIILEPISFNGGIGHGNTFTPNYVFNATYASNNSYTQLYTCSDTDYPGTGVITEGSCSQGVDNTAFPAVWMPAFQNAWLSAIGNALSHMKSASYAANVQYVRVGGGSGGEWFPFATSALLLQFFGAVNTTTIGQLKTTWTGYMSNVQSKIVSISSGFNFVQAMDGGLSGGNANGATSIPYNWCDSEAALANSVGFGMGTEGLTGNWTGATGNNSDILRFTNHGYNSGGANTFTYPSMDSAFVFHTYPNAIHQVQTGGGGASDPTGATSPGSLTGILTYAVYSLNATDIEIYYQDWEVSFDPSNGNYLTYHLAYQNAIAQARSPQTMIIPSDMTPGTVVAWNSK